MCGRTACTLDKKCIQRATSAYSNKKNVLPQWIDLHKGQNYEPNYNMSPGKLTPVIVMDKKVLPHDEADGEVVVCPMRWGLIPSWYKGSLEEFNFKTNNSRLEGILDKPTFRGPLSSGRRCVILAEGFFEWKTTASGKCPFFIFFPQENGMSMQERKWEQNTEELWSDEYGWKGPRLLTMAGIFDVWKSPEGNIYSYSVITMPSSKSLSFIHTRMPAILDGISEVKDWLDSGNIPYDKALSSLKPVENIEMFPVSTEVNNSRNNTVSCVLPIIQSQEDSKKQAPKGSSLMSWVKIRPRTSPGSSEPKRQKIDE